MTLTITHSTVVAVPDDGTSPVGTDEWNAAHTIGGGTTGSVLFIDGGGVLAQDNTNFNWNDTTDTLQIGSAQTVTASSPLFDASQTWNNAAANFTASRINVTNTASGANSLLQDWQINGTSVTSISQIGGLTCGDGITSLTLSSGTLTLAPLANAVPISISGYSLTGSSAASGFSLTGTWNTSGTPTAFVVDITDTASNGNSLLAAYKRNGSTVFSVTKSSLVGISYEATGIFYISGHTSTNAFYYNSPGPSLSAIQADSNAGLTANLLAFGSASVVGAAPVNKFWLNTDNGMAMFGGKTSSFPALINSSTTLVCKLADNSATADFQAKTLQTDTTTVASLPAPGTKGRRFFVTDATATTFWSIVAGSGANNVPVTDDGTNWRIG